MHAEAAKPVSGIALFFQLIARFFRGIFGGRRGET